MFAWSHVCKKNASHVLLHDYHLGLEMCRALLFRKENYVLVVIILAMLSELLTL